jgi:undecaprenyl diphosphate synthase
MERALKADILAKGAVPRHVAIIMDGNGRWARQRGLQRLSGHKAGVTAVRESVRGCAELGVEVLTLYAFSVENWQRPRAEIEGLMRVLKQTLRGEQAELDENDVRLETIGRVQDLPADVREQIEKTRAALADNRGLLLNLALSYGGRPEIVAAVRRALDEVAAGRLAPDRLDEQTFGSFLYTAGLPDPDLMIRTSGELRVSNFLLWQIAYAEIWVTPVLWPDFRREHLFTAIRDYQRRERRYGKVGGSLDCVGNSRP